MTITFEDRERAFEAKFAHDEEFRFRATARRDKLYARWAATQVGMSAADEDALVAEIVHLRDGRGHEAALSARIAEVLAAHGRSLPPPALAAALEACAEQARQQLLALPADHADAP